VRFLDFYYARVGNTDITKVLTQFNCKISWIVEAGCHDGRDTIALNQIFSPRRILAFEPDHEAHRRAEKLYRSINLQVELYSCGLSDEDGELFFDFPGGERGTGSTMLSESGLESVEVRRFDGLIDDLEFGGILWLDVEGHALQALKGATSMLHKLSAAKCEVQTHKMNSNRPPDFFEVCHLMKKSGLHPVNAPISPSFFGDVLFINKRHLRFQTILYSKFLYLEMYLLHKFVYPLLGKPSSK
jgi:FkbM family methyltransferase